MPYFTSAPTSPLVVNFDDVLKSRDDELSTYGVRVATRWTGTVIALRVPARDSRMTLY